MSSLEFRDVFEPYYDGRDGLAANAARDRTASTRPQPAERRLVQAPSITPPKPDNEKLNRAKPL